MLSRMNGRLANPSVLEGNDSWSDQLCIALMERIDVRSLQSRLSAEIFARDPRS